MRCIELTRALDRKKFILFIGETGFSVEDCSFSEFAVNDCKKKLAELEKLKGSTWHRGKEKVNLIRNIYGKTLIHPFPPTPAIRYEQEVTLYKTEVRMYEDTKADETTSILVCETIEEIYNLIEEADERDYRKQYKIMKEYL